MTAQEHASGRSLIWRLQPSDNTFMFWLRQAAQLSGRQCVCEQRIQQGQTVLDLKSVQVSGPDHEQPRRRSGAITVSPLIGARQGIVQASCCAAPCHASSATISNQAADSSRRLRSSVGAASSGNLLVTP